MPTLKLTRDQLASFLQDHEQIKQFERLFAVADQVSINPDTQSISIQSGNAEAHANAALAMLSRVNDLLGVLAAAPVAYPQEYHEVLAWLSPE